MGFQTSVNAQPSPAVDGDFASDNPRQALVSGPGGFVTGTGGVILGRFAWADGNGVVTNAKPGSGIARLGFVSREGQAAALITAWMGESSLTVPDGLAITLHSKCDVWMRFAAGATAGQKVYASHTDGTVLADATGQTHAGYEETNWVVLSTAAAGELARTSQEG